MTTYNSTTVPGSFVTIDDKEYIVIPDLTCVPKGNHTKANCIGCAFVNKKQPYCEQFDCSSLHREDSQGIIFIRNKA
jgi:hypothetical protein